MMNKRMTIQEIVKYDCEKTGVSFETVYVNLHNGIEDNSTRVFRSGNTLFTSEIQEPKVSEVHLFTADNANQLVKAIKEFVSAMKVAGFVKLITNTNDESLPILLKRANVNFTSMPTQNGFQIEIEV